MPENSNQPQQQTNVKSFRVTDAVIRKFKAIQDEMNLTQDGALKMLIEAYELEVAKNSIPDRSTEIANFQTKANDLISAFLNSLQLNQDAEARIRSEFEFQLNTKDKALADVQEKNRILQERNAELLGMEQQLLTEQMAKSSLQKEFEAFKDTQKMLVKQHEKQISDKDSINAMLTEKLVVAENKVAEYEDLKSEKDQVTYELQKALQTIKDNEAAFVREKRELHHSHELALEKSLRALDDAVRKVETESSELLRRAEISHTEALNNLRIELTDKAERAQNELLCALRKHSEEIKAYEKEKSILLQQISELKALNQKKNQNNENV